MAARSSCLVLHHQEVERGRWGRASKDGGRGWRAQRGGSGSSGTVNRLVTHVWSSAGRRRNHGSNVLSRQCAPTAQFNRSIKTKMLRIQKEAETVERTRKKSCFFSSSCFFLGFFRLSEAKILGGVSKPTLLQHPLQSFRRQQLLLTTSTQLLLLSRRFNSSFLAPLICFPTLFSDRKLM